MMQSKKSLKIAITGGYASGKSTCLKQFQNRGYEVFRADDIYTDLLKNPDILFEICNFLDVKPLKIDGKFFLDRKAVSQKVFSNGDLLKRLNDFTHKAVYSKIDEIYRKNIDKKLVFEIPLLFESGKQNDFDKVIVVMRDKQLRVKLGALRDSITCEDAKLRIKNQIDYDKLDKLEHTFIYNDGDLKSLYQEVDKVIDEIENFQA